MFILQNAMKVVNWIHEFDPQNVNSGDLQMPADLKTLTQHTKALLNDFPRMNALNKHKKSSSVAGEQLSMDADMANNTFSEYGLIPQDD